MKRFFTICAFLLLLLGTADAQKTAAQLNTEVSTQFADNTTGAITPAIVRTMFTDFINSFQLILSGNVCAVNTCPTVFHSGRVAAIASTSGIDVAPSVTETYIVEVFIPVNSVLTGISVLNGAGVAGRIQLAMADATGAIVAQTASAATVGTNAFQQVPFTASATVIGPQKLFLLLQENNTSSRYRAHTIGNFGASKKTGETFGTFTTITPPSTFTANQGPIADTY